jgi:hypothetical protein
MVRSGIWKTYESTRLEIGRSQKQQKSQVCTGYRSMMCSAGSGNNIYDKRKKHVDGGGLNNLIFDFFENDFL